MRGKGGGKPISARNHVSVKKQPATARRFRLNDCPFPNRIALLRKGRAKPMLQKELASRIGLSVRELRRIERGEIRPKRRHLQAVASTLHVTIADLSSTARQAQQ